MKSARVESIDALRGFDMFFITGGSAMLVALGRLVSGSPDNWLAVQMTHVDWAGFHFLDLIFALFMFLAGASWPFSLAGRRARGVREGAGAQPETAGRLEEGDGTRARGRRRCGGRCGEGQVPGARPDRPTVTLMPFGVVIAPVVRRDCF